MVERYSPYSMSPTTFEPTKTGAWVRYSDHEALERRAEMLEKSAGFATDDVARLETENATLRARVEELERERDERPKVGEWMRLIKREKVRADRLQSLLDEARKALEPFAKVWVAEQFPDGMPADFALPVKVGDLRRARATLSRLTEMEESNG